MILIGLPIYKRAWILPEWFSFIESQTVPLSELGFIFELGDNDDETHDMLWEWHTEHPEVAIFDGVIRLDENHKEHPPNGRFWRRADYPKMVTLRNNLLERARALEPDLYFSLDSDILLTEPATIEILAEIASKPGVAVSPLMYMGPDGKKYPSVMTWADRPGHLAKRPTSTYPLGSLFRADIIMAAKMMAKDVYTEVDYYYHNQGEDLGWSADAAVKGKKLYCASYIYAEHIMSRSMLQNWRLGQLESRAAV